MNDNNCWKVSKCHCEYVWTETVLWNNQRAAELSLEKSYTCNMLMYVQGGIFHFLQFVFMTQASYVTSLYEMKELSKCKNINQTSFKLAADCQNIAYIHFIAWCHNKSCEFSREGFLLIAALRRCNIYLAHCKLFASSGWRNMLDITESSVKIVIMYFSIKF